MTTCNEFVGKFGATLGSKNYLGTFFLDTLLAKWGKGARLGAVRRRRTAEVRRQFRVLHMGISLHCNGDEWNKAESGQGGKNLAYDVIKRNKSTYPGSALQGWVDLELYFGPAAQIGPVPDWLVGWWKVTFRGQAYYYYFDRNRQVKWTQILPHDTSQPPLAPRDTGTFAVLVTNAVITRWGATGSVEKFIVMWNDPDEQMRWDMERYGAAHRREYVIRWPVP